MWPLPMHMDGWWHDVSIHCRRRQVAGARGGAGVDDGVGVVLLEARGYLVA